MPDATVVGFVGLGNMGKPMTANLAAAGYRVRGYDVVPEVAALAAGPDVDVVDSLTGVAAGAGTVILMLPNSDVVEHVLLAGGLLAALADGTVLIDMSSSEPARTRTLAAAAAERGIVYLDAPVSGGVTGARKGSLTVMAGGPADAVAAATPLLSTMGAKVIHCGQVGAGDAVKALNNLMSATHLLVSSEAILAGRAFGVDPAVLLDVVNGSSGRSGSTENKWPNFVLPGTYDSGFGLRLMTKDMRIALDLERATGVPARLSEVAVALWSQAEQALPPDADHTEIVRWLEAGARTEEGER